ncbi:MAG: hypothetical protein NTV95_01575 [Candidatus Saccharibacteria bacterium]|nr:hypothetical protein [Candidatus Saccharibacteria bacterium]
MDKQYFRKLHSFLQRINVYVLVVVLVVSTAVCVFALRQNNLQALKLRDAVIAADKDNKDVEGALTELRTFMYSHMNTSLSSGPNAIKPPIQLKYSYERLVEAEQQRLTVENSKVYIEAQAECEKRFPKGLSGSGRIPCITDYVASRGVEQKNIPDSLYKFDFVSPTWSPDLAGWSMLAAIVSGVFLVLRLLLDRWAKAEIRDL